MKCRRLCFTLLTAVFMTFFALGAQAQGETFGGGFSNSGAGVTTGADRTGTAGAQYLLIPGTAKLASLGTAVTAGLAGWSGLEALGANPAALTLNTGTSVLFSRMEYVADIGINTFGVAQRFGFSNIALMVTSWDIGKIPVQTEENPEISDLTFSPTFLQIGLSYAREVTDNIGVGVTFKLLSEKMDDLNATGIAFDAGMIYLVPETGLRFGVSLKNFGPQISYGGDGLTREVRVPGQLSNAASNSLAIESADFELPSLLNFGVSYSRTIGAGVVGTIVQNFRSNSFSNDQYSTGLELAFLELFYVRGGFQVQKEQSETTFFRGVNLGAGLSMDISGNALSVDYAYLGTEFFSDVHALTVGVTL